MRLVGAGEVDAVGMVVGAVVVGTMACATVVVVGGTDGPVVRTVVAVVAPVEGTVVALSGIVVAVEELGSAVGVVGIVVGIVVGAVLPAPRTESGMQPATPTTKTAMLTIAFVRLRIKSPAS